MQCNFKRSAFMLHINFLVFAISTIPVRDFYGNSFEFNLSSTFFFPVGRRYMYYHLLHHLILKWNIFTWLLTRLMNSCKGYQYRLQARKPYLYLRSRYFDEIFALLRAWKRHSESVMSIEYRFVTSISNLYYICIIQQKYLLISKVSDNIFLSNGVV